MPKRNSTEVSQGDIQPSDCSKKSTSCDCANNYLYKWLAKILYGYPIHQRNETNKKTLIAQVMLETEDKTAGEPVDTTNDCVNAKHVI